MLGRSQLLRPFETRYTDVPIPVLGGSVRIRNVTDELHEGDQIMVKVLALDGNKIKLSRKAVLREQRQKLKSGD